MLNKKGLHDVSLARFNCDDRVKIGNIYNGDQLTAMIWSLSAWTEFSVSTIKDCLNHTGLFTKPATVSMTREEVVNMEVQKETGKEIYRDHNLVIKLNSSRPATIWSLASFWALSERMNAINQSS